MVSLLPELEPDARLALTRRLCEDRGTRPFAGWAAWNRSQAAADDARTAVCR